MKMKKNTPMARAKIWPFSFADGGDMVTVLLIVILVVDGGNRGCESGMWVTLSDRNCSKFISNSESHDLKLPLQPCVEGLSRLRLGLAQTAALNSKYIVVTNLQNKYLQDKKQSTSANEHY